MASNPPYGTSFPIPSDVDYQRPLSNDLDGYGATTITSGVRLATPFCGTPAQRNLATPNAPAIANYTVTPPATPAATPQPVDPMED